MTDAINSTTSGIYRKGWAALAVKAAGKASGVRARNAGGARLHVLDQRQSGIGATGAEPVPHCRQFRAPTQGTRGVRAGPDLKPGGPRGIRSGVNRELLFQLTTANPPGNLLLAQSAGPRFVSVFK